MAASRVAILLEDIQGKVQATMEAVTATRKRKADHETLLKLQARVEVVERRLGISQPSTKA